jgi:hypothetical protein
MKTDINIKIDGELYAAEVEYFFFTEEESNYQDEHCNIESIVFDNNIATDFGFPIQKDKDVSNFIENYYNEVYEEIKYRCLVDYKRRQANEWTFIQEEQ